MHEDRSLRTARGLVISAALVPLLQLPAGAAGPLPGSGPCESVASLFVPEVTRGGLAPGPHTVVLDGVRFWYCVGGNAAPGRPPVVFLHGGPGQGSQHFAALSGRALEGELQLVYFDQRGSGRSERPWTKEYDLPTLVEDIEHLRVALGVEKMALIGHSFGGLLALEYAAAYPERVAGLVFLAGLSDLPATLESMCARLERLAPAEYARAAKEPAPGARCNPFAAFSGEAREAYTRGSMFPDTLVAKRLEEADRLGGLRNTGELSAAFFNDPESYRVRFTGHSRISSPVLVVAGKEDHQIGLEPQRQLAERLPHARLLVLERGGHFPHLDEPELFAREVIEFMRSIP